MNLLLEGRLAPDERATWWAALTAALPEAHWIDGATAAEAERATAEVAVVANPEPGRLAGCGQLRLIQSLWAGVDRLMTDETLPPRVPVARMVDPAMTAAMAETACWAVLGLHRGFFDYAAQQQAGVWRQLPQRRADEVQVLVMGMGQLGGSVARRLVALGYPVTGWSLQPRAVPGVRSVQGEGALVTALARTDVLVNLLPLTEATRGLYDATRFAQLRPGAGFVNLARGAHVVEADLLAALDSGQVGRAVLDVFATEPLPAGHAFWAHPRVTVLPHAAALTDARSAAGIVARQVQALQAGQPLQHLVERLRGY